MTTKEKAKELVERLCKESATDGMSFIPTDWLNNFHTETSKACAIICVDEIISQLNKLQQPEYAVFYHGLYTGSTIDGCELISYWELVKKEIEKL